MTQTLIESRSLCKIFRAGRGREIRAVDDISVSIERGTFTTLTGPSGSGKTTLLSLIGGLERPTSGSLKFEGREMSASSDVELARMRRRMGFMFQDFALLPRLNLVDNIGYPLIPRGISSSERRTIAVQLLERLQLSQQVGQRPEELSSGERQRVALARAIAGNPVVMLADEPTSNLDDENGQRVIQLLREIQQNGTTIIVTSHDPKLLSAATQIFRLNRGQHVS